MNLDCDEAFTGYPGVPLASLAKACEIVQLGETIVLRAGVYREVLALKHDGLTVRAMKGENVTISGADVIEDWRREANGNWSAPLPSTPSKILRDGQPFSKFAYDQGKQRIRVPNGDPRLHLFETVVRKERINLSDSSSTKMENITVTNTLD